MESTPRTFSYQIDANDHITRADAACIAFACENGSPQPTEVVGRLLWDFLADHSTIHVYRVLVRKVRVTGKPVVFPFRCDSPSCRRFMEMEIRAGADGAVDFHSRLIREEARDPVVLLEDAGVRDGFVRMCSWCKKVFMGEGCWVEVEEAVSALNLMAVNDLPAITHAICEDCREVCERDLESAEDCALGGSSD